MRVTFIRHGETAANIIGTIQDIYVDMPLALTEKGIEQAKEAWELLKDEKFDAIYVSDMQRTQETARYIFPNRMHEFILDSRLREHLLSTQHWVKYSYAQLGREVWSKMRLEGFPDGESFAQQTDRVRNFIEELATKSNENVAVVTHGGSMRALYVISGLHDPLNALLVDQIKNCGFIRGELDKDGKLTLEME